MCQWLEERGLDVFELNNNGHSSVHKAAMKGSFEVAEWLLAHPRLDASHLQPDEDGYLPSDMAELQGHLALSRMLTRTEAELGVERAAGPGGGRGEKGKKEAAPGGT